MQQEINKTILNKAVQLLALRDHSAFELKQKLLQFTTASSSHHDNMDEENIDVEKMAQIDAVIQYCVTQNWLNDKRYIEHYISMRSQKGHGRYKIKFELQKRGLSPEMINEILDKSDIDWVNIASHQIKKKFHQIDKRDIKQKYKINQFLLYRGFSQEEIQIAYFL